MILFVVLMFAAVAEVETITPVDCSLAVPDRTVGSVRLDVCEISVEKDVSPGG